MITPSLGQRTGRYRRRRGPVRALVVHTTGRGPGDRLSAARFARWRRRHPEVTSAHEAALWVYRYAMTAAPHYVIGQQGEEAQVTDDDLVAWHVGSRGAWRYRLPRWSTAKTAWWGDRWPDLRSPRDLAGGRLWAGGANANTIGIEVVAPLEQPTGPWAEEAWTALVELVRRLAERHSLPLTADRLPSHSDCHPRARSAQGAPWDPSPEAYTPERMVARLSQAEEGAC